MGDANGGRFIVYKRKRESNSHEANGDELQEGIEIETSAMEQGQAAPTDDARIGNIMEQETSKEDKIDERLLMLSREIMKKPFNKEKACKPNQSNHEESNEKKQIDVEYTPFGLALKEKFFQIHKSQKGSLQPEDAEPRQVRAKQRSNHDILTGKGVNDSSSDSSPMRLNGKGIADPYAEAPKRAQDVSATLKSITSTLNKNEDTCRCALTSLKGKGIAAPAALEKIKNLSASGTLHSKISLLNENVNAFNYHAQTSSKGKGITIADASTPKATQNVSSLGGHHQSNTSLLLNAIAKACGSAPSFKGKGIATPSTPIPEVAAHQNVSALGGLQPNLSLLNANMNAYRSALSLNQQGNIIANAASAPPKMVQQLVMTPEGLQFQTTLDTNLKSTPSTWKNNNPAGFLKRNTKPHDWSELELDSLWIGVRRYGQNNWEKMLSSPIGFVFKNRSPQDLYNKWNMERLKILHPISQPIIPRSIPSANVMPSTSSSPHPRQGTYLLSPPPHLGRPNYPAPPTIADLFPITSKKFPQKKVKKNNNNGAGSRGGGHKPVIVLDDSDSEGCSEETPSA